MEKETRIRRRCNVATSVKGVITFETTLETENLPEDEHFELLDSMFNECIKRYPPNKDDKV